MFMVDKVKNNQTNQLIMLQKQRNPQITLIHTGQFNKQFFLNDFICDVIKRNLINRTLDFKDTLMKVKSYVTHVPSGG
jgi:hypothetical protein